MIIVGETEEIDSAPKEQFPKKPWDRNSQVKRLQLDAPLERAEKPPKGNPFDETNITRQIVLYYVSYRR